MATHSGQKMKLEFEMKSFEANLEFMQKESEEEMNKILVSGASAYATSASKHTPPSAGKQKIDPMFYGDGVWYDRSSKDKAHGRRRVYDLLQLARNPDTGHYRKHYGTLLRMGFYYVVSIYRKGKLLQIPCKTLAEAGKYAYESYRGLTRAAWGLRFSELSGKMPPAFRKYVAERPELSKMASLNTVTINRVKHEVQIVNHVVDSNDPYMSKVDTNASIAAVKTMNDRMNKYFKKKFDL